MGPTISAVALLFGAAFGISPVGLAEEYYLSPESSRPAARAANLDAIAEAGPLDAADPLDAAGPVDPLAPISASWEGMFSSGSNDYEPPDTHGAAGPDGIIQVLNVRIAYWDKTGKAIWGPTPLEGATGFFKPAGNQFFSFDPRALYDRQSGRFYVVQVEEDDASQQSFINVAVSKTSNPVTRTVSDWYFYRINNTRTVRGNKYWGDYPGLGFDSQAIYVTFNLYAFSGNNGDGQIAVLQKSAFLNGTTNYAFVHTSGGPAGGFTLQPCTVIGGNSPSNVAYFGETPLASSTSVRVWALRDPLGARTLSSANVTVPNNGGYIGSAPQPGTSGTIPTLATRSQGNAFWYNGEIWFCHTAGGSSGKSRAYYYKVNLNNYPSGTPSLGESGFIDGGPGEWTYQPSIGANSRGDVCLVYCQSSATRNPTIFAAIHAATASSFDTPILVKASPGYYNGTRWGDYASVTADPIDDSFWVTHEWAKTKQSRGWSTWWAQLGAPAPNPDGIMEIAIAPLSGSTLVAGAPQGVFVGVSDSVGVKNATVVATVNGGSNLVFLNNGVPPDVTTNDAIYSATLAVPLATNDLTLNFLITAPGKTNSTNSVIYSVVPVPVNDYFTNAIKAPPEGAAYFSNNKFATLEPGEPQPAGLPSAAASLWWNWSPVSTTDVLIDTTGSTVDTVVAVYTGLTVTNLTQVIAINDVGTKKQAYLNFPATGGASYRIAVYSVNSNSSGSLRLLIAPGGYLDTNSPTVAIASPLNGQYASNFLVTVSGTANDPQPDASGVTRVVLSVNGQLPLVATGTTNWSSIFGLNPGLNRIRVTAEDLAGNVSAASTIDVTYVLANPVNDLFANALFLTAVPDVVSVITTNATKEFDEPNHAGNSGGKSAWWSFQPPADGALALSTTNSQFDTVLGLYTGPNVRELTTVASNDDAYPGAPGGFSALTQAVRSNEVYYVAVDGFDGASGVVTLRYAFTPAPLFTLTTSSVGGGQVAPSSGEVVSNSAVMLTATPDVFYTFDHWAIGSALLSVANPLSFVVTSNTSVTAYFQPMSFTDDFETGDLSHIGWSSAGNLPWVVQSNYTLAGTFAARSGAIGDGQTSSLVLTTNFSGGLGTFYFRLSSELDWDIFSFFVDGVLQQKWSGRIPWMSYGFSLSAGTHTLEWRYAKDSNLAAGLDAAFLDNISLPLGVGINASTPAQLQIFRQPNGSLLLQVLGQTNQQYVIQGTTNLTPTIFWQNLSTNVATGGVIQYVDPGTNPLRFYRAVVTVP